MITRQDSSVAAPTASGTVDLLAVQPANIAVLTADVSVLTYISTILNGPAYRITERRHARALSDLVSDHRTDAVILDLSLPVNQKTDLNGLMRGGRRDRTIPIIGICTRDVSRAARLGAMGIGVWDVIEIPVAVDELLTKLENWVSLKRSFDQVRSGILVDVETGHYSAAGIKRRFKELAAMAKRSGQPLSCVLFGIDRMVEGARISPLEVEKAARNFARFLRERTRNSDVVGRVEPLKFMVLAPDTPPEGAMTLAERFTSWSVSRRMQGVMPITFSAGVAGVDGQGDQLDGQPELLLVAASRALNGARESAAAQVAVA